MGLTDAEENRAYSAFCLQSRGTILELLGSRQGLDTLAAFTGLQSLGEGARKEAAKAFPGGVKPSMGALKKLFFTEGYIGLITISDVGPR